MPPAGLATGAGRCSGGEGLRAVPSSFSGEESRLTGACWLGAAGMAVVPSRRFGPLFRMGPASNVLVGACAAGMPSFGFADCGGRGGAARPGVSLARGEAGRRGEVGGDNCWSASPCDGILTTAEGRRVLAFLSFESLWLALLSPLLRTGSLAWPGCVAPPCASASVFLCRGLTEAPSPVSALLAARSFESAGTF